MRQKLRQKLLVSVLALFVGGAVVVASPAPAAAAVTPANCAIGQLVNISVPGNVGTRVCLRGVAPVSEWAPFQADQAVVRAWQQRGKPYVWGAAGPNAFDCSGLVQFAFKYSGRLLIHYTVSQYYQTRGNFAWPLRRGDLLFHYGLDHVGIYLGGGWEVHAPTPGSVVQVVRWNSMPISHLGRPIPA
jgi:cell wall-associated NlpC family hydrolase